MGRAQGCQGDEERRPMYICSMHICLWSLTVPTLKSNHQKKVMGERNHQKKHGRDEAHGRDPGCIHQAGLCGYKGARAKEWCM